MVPLVPVAAMCLLALFAGHPEPVDLATRGAKPPPVKTRSLLNPSSWEMNEWLADGLDRVMTWQLNPWKKRDGLGYHYQVLQESDKPDDVAELARLRQIGKEWHERILARYPELAIKRLGDVPEEANGTHQWNELVKRLRAEGKDSLLTEKFPGEFSRHLEKGAPLDAQAAREWLEKNRATLDEIRAIGLLPGHSIGEIPANEMSGDYIFWSRDAGLALLLDARLAAEEGEVARALESIRAAGGLADHLGENEMPTLLSMVLANSNRNQIRNSVFSSILPSISGGQVDIAAWEDAVAPGVRQTTDIARIMRGEWNYIMPVELLPVFSDPAETRQPVDADQLVESYTQYIQGQVRLAENPSSGPAPEIPLDNLSGRSRDLAGYFGMTGEYRSQWRWELSQAQAGMTQAAFAILRGLPVPNDPISGEPYVWNPDKRTLALPQKYGKTGNRQIVLPRL